MKTKIQILVLALFILGCKKKGDDNETITHTQPNTITVNSKITYIDPDPVFIATVSLSNDSELNFSSIKERFKKSIEEHELSWTNIKELPKDSFRYQSIGAKNEEIIYQYETKSIPHIKRFLNIKLPTLQHLDANSKIEIDIQEAEEIVKMAHDKSLKKARLLAKVMKRKVGNIISIKENSSLLSKDYSVSLAYSFPTQFNYALVVTYELK